MSADLMTRKPVFGRTEQIVFFVYLFVTLFLVFCHEPWEDELQVWCIAQELSIPEIFHLMRYEGHFALWPLLMKPFVWLGMPLAMLNLLAWILCVTAAGMLLAFRRFGKTVKILILLSCPVIYWFPVISRNYALIPLALCLLAGLYPVRLKKPFAYAFSLLLLVHSHAYMEGLAGILGVFFAWDLLRHSWRMPVREKLKSGGVLVLIGAGVLAAFLQVAPAFGTSAAAPASMSSLLANWSGARLWNVLERLSGDYALWFGRLSSKKLAAVLFYGALAFGVFQLFRTRGARAGIMFLCGFIWQLLFAVLLYPMALHRVYLPFLMLVFCFALPVRKPKKSASGKILNALIPLGVLCVLTFPDTLHYISMDISLPFSNQSQMSFFIERNIPEKAKIVVFPDSLITGTFRAYLPNRIFYRSSDGQPFRVFRTPVALPDQLDDALLKRLTADEKEIYLLFQAGAFLSYNLPKAEEYDFPSFRMTLVFGTRPKAFFTAGEDYALFKVTRKSE